MPVNVFYCDGGTIKTIYDREVSLYMCLAVVSGACTCVITGFPSWDPPPCTPNSGVDLSTLQVACDMSGTDLSNSDTLTV
jgi:hypothetical protein